MEKAKKQTKKEISRSVFLISLIAAIVASVTLTLVLLFFSLGGALRGTSKISAEQLDVPIATYYLNGFKTVTTRSVLNYYGELDSYKIDDNTYNMPVAADIVGYIQEEVLINAAKNQGASVNDAQYQATMIELTGTSNITDAAKYLEKDEDGAKEAIINHALFNQLKTQVISEKVSDAKAAPVAPEDGNNETESAEYADYIKSIVGEEWDTTKNEWKLSGIGYDQAFEALPFDGTKATYVQALIAYYVYCENTLAQSSEGRSAWLDYQDAMLANLSIFLPAAL